MADLYCPQCQHEASEEFSFCPKCGSPLTAPTAAASTDDEPTVVLPGDLQNQQPGMSLAGVTDTISPEPIAPPLSPSGDGSPKELHGIFQPSDSDRLCLEIGHPGGVQNVGLLAAREVSLGRKRGTNDIVLRVMPHDSENEKRTNRISRRHARLRFEPEGVTWENLDCGGGTMIGDTLLRKSESIRVSQDATVSPAGQLPLGCALFYDDQSCVESEYVPLAQQVEVAPPADPVGPVSAVRLERRDALRSTESYILFQNDLILGGSRACPICVDAPSVSPLHARLLWFGGSFWLEPLQKAQPTCVDGQPVAMNHVAQLRADMHVQLGKVDVAVHPFRQCHIDFDP